MNLKLVDVKVKFQSKVLERMQSDLDLTNKSFDLTNKSFDLTNKSFDLTINFDF